MRNDGRKADELRRVRITPNFLDNPEGSCLIEIGKTKVICTASFECEGERLLNFVPA